MTEYTAQELADALNVSIKTVRRWTWDLAIETDSKLHAVEGGSGKQRKVKTFLVPDINVFVEHKQKIANDRKRRAKKLNNDDELDDDDGSDFQTRITPESLKMAWAIRILATIEKNAQPSQQT